MMSARPLILASIVPLAAVFLAGGCASDRHAVTPVQPGQVSVCTKCYDEITKMRGTYHPRTGYTGDRVIKTHRCDDCKSDMSIYEQGDVLKVRCALCAPEGVDCDRCVPRVSK